MIFQGGGGSRPPAPPLWIRTCKVIVSYFHSAILPNLQVQAEVAAGREIDEDDFARRVHIKLQSKGAKTKHLQRNDAALEMGGSSPMAKKLSNLKSMSEVRKNYAPSGDVLQSMPMSRAPMGGMPPPAPKSRMRGGGMGGGPPAPPPPPPPMSSMMDGSMGAGPPLPPPPPMSRMMYCSMGAGPPPPMLPMAYSDFAPPPPPSGGVAGASDHYKTVEDEISYEQSARMVQKSIARNFAKKKGT